MNDNGGFSLIEMMVTIAIVGFAVVPLINGFVFSWQTIIEAQNRSKAVSLANSMTNHLRSVEGFDGNLDKSGNFEDFFGNPELSDFEYETNVQSIGGSYTNFEAKQVTLQIRFPSQFSNAKRSLKCADASNCSLPDNPDRTIIIANQEAP